MQLTPDELSLDRINEALNRGEDVVIKARKKVEPMQGPFFLRGSGTIGDRVPIPDISGFIGMGLAFNTLEQAETAKPIIRRVGRYLNWVLANCPGHDPSGPGSVPVTCKSGEWGFRYVENNDGMLITMPTGKAIEFCRLLNSGAYTL